jgi:hypothetical protein
MLSQLVQLRSWMNSIADQEENSDIAGDFEITTMDDNISII